MASKHKAVLAGIGMMVVLLGIYVYLRKDFIGTSYINKITLSAESIENLTGEYLKSAGKKNLLPHEMRSLLASITERFPDVGAAAISDTNYKIKEVSRNAVLEQDQVFSAFQSDYTERRLTSAGSGKPLYKDYKYNQGGKDVNSGLYIFIKDLRDGNKLALAFPFMIDRKILARLGLEIFLILAIIIIISSLIYILSERKNYDGSKKSFERIKDAEERESGDDGYSAIRGIFTDICAHSGAESLFLYLKNKKNRLSAAYGLDGERLLELNGKDARTIDAAIEKELSSTAAFVADKGNKLLLPIKHKGTLAAALELRRDVPFSGTEIRQMKSSLKNLIDTIPESLKLRMEDEPATGISGLHSMESYKEILAQLADRYNYEQTDFSVIILSCLNGMGRLTPSQKELALKFIVPEVKKYIGHNDKIFEYGEYLIVLMEDTSSSYAEMTGKKIAEILSEFRLKVDANNSRVMKPLFSSASTDSGIPPEMLISSAIKELRNI